MELREALRIMRPNLLLQRAAMDEIAQLDKRILELESRVKELEASTPDKSQPEPSTPE